MRRIWRLENLSIAKFFRWNGMKGSSFFMEKLQSNFQTEINFHYFEKFIITQIDFNNYS